MLDNHGKASTWCDAEWHDSPYSARNGGFLHSPEDLFRDPVAREVYRKKLRYLYEHLIGVPVPGGGKPRCRFIRERVSE